MASLPAILNAEGERNTLLARPSASLLSTWAGRTAMVIGAVTLVRVFIASHLGLTDTEAYYSQWGRFPALSYCDHPPLVAWTSWLALRLGYGASAVRVVPIVCAVALGVGLYRLTASLFSPRAGFYAVAVLNLIPVYLLSGLLLNPETILLPLWIFFLQLLSQLRNGRPGWLPLALGLAIGVAFLAKYTAILAIPVVLLHIARTPSTRGWLRRPVFYLGGLVALLVASPVIIWNAMHQWASLHLHFSERLLQPSQEGVAASILRVGLGQEILFQPLIYPLLLALLVFTLTAGRHDPRYRFLATTSVPVLAFLLAIMVHTTDSEPHWTMAACLPLVMAAGGVLDEATGRWQVVAHRCFRVALASGAILAVVGAIHLCTPALARTLPFYEASGDPINETVGWDRIRAAITLHAARLGPATVVAAAHNVLCGHLQAALDDSPPVYCPSARPTEYDFMDRRSPPPMAPVVFVIGDRYPADLDPQDAARSLPDHRCMRSQEVEVDREGLHVGTFSIYDCMPSPMRTTAPNVTLVEGVPKNAASPGLTRSAPSGG